jgi:hypothetical protein
MRQIYSKNQVAPKWWQYLYSLYRKDYAMNTEHHENTIKMAKFDMDSEHSWDWSSPHSVHSLSEVKVEVPKQKNLQ